MAELAKRYRQLHLEVNRDETLREAVCAATTSCCSYKDEYDGRRASLGGDQRQRLARRRIRRRSRAGPIISRHPLMQSQEGFRGRPEKNRVRPEGLRRVQTLLAKLKGLRGAPRLSVSANTLERRNGGVA